MILDDQRKEKQRAYYRKNKERLIAACRRYHARNKRKIAEIRKRYRLNNRAKVAEMARSFSAKKRQQIINKLGSKCCKCGFLDQRVLIIHHKKIMTKKHRRDWFSKNYDLSKLELICSNCHAIIHFHDYKNITRKY